LNGEEVKKHPFFRSIDWDKLYKKEVEPVFKPPVRSETDVSQIDPVFTSEKAIDSVVEGSAISKTAESDNGDFTGFTYVAPTAMGEALAD